MSDNRFKEKKILEVKRGDFIQKNGGEKLIFLGNDNYYIYYVNEKNESVKQKYIDECFLKMNSDPISVKYEKEINQKYWKVGNKVCHPNVGTGTIVSVCKTDIEIEFDKIQKVFSGKFTINEIAMYNIDNIKELDKEPDYIGYIKELEEICFCEYRYASAYFESLRNKYNLK